LTRPRTPNAKLITRHCSTMRTKKYEANSGVAARFVEIIGKNIS
jgi:hypothetical protein